MVKLCGTFLEHIFCMENIIASNQEDLADLRTHIISAKSTKNYNGAITNFVFWIYLNCPIEICAQIREILDPHRNTYEECLAQISIQDIASEMLGMWLFVILHQIKKMHLEIELNSTSQFVTSSMGVVGHRWRLWA